MQMGYLEFRLVGVPTEMEKFECDTEQSFQDTDLRFWANKPKIFVKQTALKARRAQGAKVICYLDLESLSLLSATLNDTHTSYVWKLAPNLCFV